MTLTITKLQCRQFGTRLASNRNTVIGALFLSLVLLLTACGRTTEPADFPPVPTVDVKRYLPVIQKQLNTAIADVEKSPLNASTNAELGKLLFTYDQFRSASILLERAALLDPGEFRWPYLKGRALAELGDTDAAQKSLMRALDLNSDYGPVNIHLAELYLKAGRLDDAQEAVSRVLKQEPLRPEAYFIQAKLDSRNGNAKDAIAHLQTVERLSGHFGALHYQYSQLYRMLGDDQKADAHLTRYEQLREVTADVVDPVMGEMLELDMSVTHLINRAKRLTAQGRNDSALDLLEQAVINDPESLAAHVTLIGLYSSIGRFADSDRHILKASEIDVAHPKLHYAIGVARLLEQRRTEATNAFKKSIELDPDNADAHAQLGLLYEQQDRDREAHREYKKALSRSPVHRIAHWRLGRMSLEQDNTTEAIKHLSLIRDLADPASPEILIDLAKAYAKTDQLEESIVALQESIRLSDRFGNQNTASIARNLLNKYQRQLKAEEQS